jgi:hypothetical protein
MANGPIRNSPAANTDARRAECAFALAYAFFRN